jgi:hypothetical protein
MSAWARDYPRAARPLFELAYRYPSALLGRDGDAILGATLEEGGTMLWRVTRRRVEKLGDVRAWIREGVEVLLSERLGGGGTMNRVRILR